MVMLNVRVSESMLAAIDKSIDRSMCETRTTVVRNALKNYLTEKGIEIEQVKND